MLTPEADRQQHFILLPFVVGGAAGPARDPDAPADAFNYTVQPGDTLWSLALDFGRDLDTMSCATTPTGSDAETLTPWKTIVVPALNDLCYTVTPSDTLAGIAARHGLTVDDIVGVPWNGFAAPPYRVVARRRAAARRTPQRQFRGAAHGQHPGAARSQGRITRIGYGDGHFIWPVKGWISQRRADRPRRNRHCSTERDAGQGSRPRHGGLCGLEPDGLRLPRGHRSRHRLRDAVCAPQRHLRRAGGRSWRRARSSAQAARTATSPARTCTSSWRLRPAGQPAAAVTLRTSQSTSIPYGRWRRV